MDIGEYMTIGASCCTHHVTTANNQFTCEITCCKDAIRGKWEQDKPYPNMYLK